jgi:hypothetical protein
MAHAISRDRRPYHGPKFRRVFIGLLLKYSDIDPILLKSAAIVAGAKI